MTNYANRGQALEELISCANRQYAAQGIAVIQKVPTPTKVIRDGRRIVSAFFSEPSTVDYIGNYRGVPIAFDAKETGISTRFDLRLIEEHQYQFLLQWHQMGGLAFLVIYFTSLDAHYLLPFILLEEAWRGAQSGRKSIPMEVIREKAKGIGTSKKAVLDYLAAV